MDISPLRQQSEGNTKILKPTKEPTKKPAAPTKSKRYKLQRSTEYIDEDHSDDILIDNNTPKELQKIHETSVMGGGFATPPPNTNYSQKYIKNTVEEQSKAVTVSPNATATATATAILTNLSNNEPATNFSKDLFVNHSLPMHEKLLENDGCDKNPTKDKTEKLKTKTHKESKFAEKLRKSFRRSEHKSLEIKRQDKKELTGDLKAAQERSSSLRPLQQHHLQQSPSIFSLTNLPGLGGHINPALLLDSPDESTPPEFAYRHLSSVATTNSSTSLESNFCESPTTSISYWAWHMNNNNMGGEISTTTNTNNPNTPANLGSNNEATQTNRKRLEQQSSSKSDYDHPPVTTASRSCSTASESSTAAKLSRLQNFLFKSSNESSRSIQGHSNEGFTASSNNSTSGEWENLCNFPSTSSTNPLHTEDPLQFPSERQEVLPVKTDSLSETNSSVRNYYQYTLASPNNPFLPEITARTYHSTYEEEDEERELEDELDANVTSVKYRIGTHSAQLATPNYSRTGSQESTHSEYAAGSGGKEGHMEANIQTQALYSYSSSTAVTPGKHKRKLFSLSTPTKLNTATQQQPPSSQPLPPPQHHQPLYINTSSTSSASQHLPSKSTSASSSYATTDYTNQFHQHPPSLHPQPLHFQQPTPPLPPSLAPCAQPHRNITKTSSCNLVRSLNPFLPSTTVTSSSPPQRTSSSSSLNKRTGPFKQKAVTSPIAVPSANPLKDLNSRREEFLKATMQICLVVSPPSSRLQLKSKSLTHLDGLETEMVCNHAKNSNNTIASITSTLTSAYPLSPSSLSPPLPQYQHQHHHHSTSNTSTTNAKHRSHSPQRSLHPKVYSSTTRLTSSRLTPTIYTQAPQQPTTKSLPNNLNSPTSHTPSCTTTTTAACCKSRICSSHIGSAPSSSSNLQQYSSHHHYHPNKFQSDVVSSSATAVQLSSTPSSSSQHTLKPLPLPSVIDNNAICCSSSSATLSLSAGGDMVVSGTSSITAISSATSLHPHGGSVTPTSYKKKSSFLQRKKPILTRSEVSSSEYFSVSFCTESGCQDEEFFPATKGVILVNALSQALRKRNLSFTQLTITDSNDNNQNPAFLEAGSSPLLTSLDENTEVENLAGHHLIVMDKENSRKTLQKAASFGSRARPPRLLSSASTDESSDANLTGKQLKQRWSGLFGVKNPQQSQLCELLNTYSKNGVPQKTPATLNFDHPSLDNAIEYLDHMHKSWMDIVESVGMNDSEMRIQTAIWELVTTEVDYIHCLQTVTDLFLACLESVQEEGLLKEVDQHRLFANIRDICEANLKFWTLYLYPMVSHSINTREPLRVAFFQQGFIAFANIFSPYKKYCAEQSTCQFYCKELNRTNSLFTAYLAWCESQKMCNRLRLADILVRPMQRLTKYSLLLAAIKKQMTDVEEIEAIETMLHTTENFVFSVNNHLTTRQEHERLKGVMARIESYDVVDTNNEHLEKMIKQYSQMFDLCGPMKGCASQHVRHLFMEGDHKYKDNLGKVEVHCFLLTDMLLICKSIAKKGLGTLKVIRQPYLTDRLVVQHSNNILSCIYLNEFQVAISAFTLQCTEAKNWYEALKRAKMIYTRLKQSSVTPWETMRYAGSMASAGTVDSLGVKKSPMNSSICSHVTSANNSHSGSVEWNDSRNISVDFDKTNSLSSDEGCSFLGAHGFPVKSKPVTTISPQKLKVNTTSSSNMLTVQPLNHLGQSLPNLNLHHSHTNLYHTYSNNTLLVPGTANIAHSGTLLLSPSHRGISYPPPSPTRVPLRRGMAFSNSIKNPPLLKTRNITSQNSINWHQIFATTPAPITTPHSQQTSLSNKVIPLKTAGCTNNPAVSTITEQPSNTITTTTAAEGSSSSRQLQLTNNPNFTTQLSNSTETDV